MLKSSANTKSANLYPSCTRSHLAWTVGLPKPRSVCCGLQPVLQQTQGQHLTLLLISNTAQISRSIAQPGLLEHLHVSSYKHTAATECIDGHSCCLPSHPKRLAYNTQHSVAAVKLCLAFCMCGGGTPGQPPPMTMHVMHC